MDEVISLAGLGEVAHQRVGSFSLGMGQRLGIAAALLGDPQVIMLDEPVNGLDPEGVLWVRTLLTGLAAEGRTVLVSSHLMTEMALTATHLIVIGRGKLIADQSVAEFTARAAHNVVRVRAPQAGRLRELLAGPDVTVTMAGDTPGALEVRGLTSDQIGTTAGANGLTLYELSPQSASLEDAFMELTHDAVEYQAGTPALAGRSTP